MSKPAREMARGVVPKAAEATPQDEAATKQVCFDVSECTSRDGPLVICRCCQVKLEGLGDVETWGGWIASAMAHSSQSKLQLMLTELLTHVVGVKAESIGGKISKKLLDEFIRTSESSKEQKAAEDKVLCNFHECV
jgi:hypothetical protein